MKAVIVLVTLTAMVSPIASKLLDNIDESVQGIWYVESCSSQYSLPQIKHYKLSVQYSEYKPKGRKKLIWYASVGNGALGLTMVQIPEQVNYTCELSDDVDASLMKNAFILCQKVNSLKYENEKLTVYTDIATCVFDRKNPEVTLR